MHEKCLKESNTESFDLCKRNLKEYQSTFKNTVLLLENSFQEVKKSQYYEFSTLKTRKLPKKCWENVWNMKKMVLS